MLFRKKKEEEMSDQLASYQERKDPRWGSPQHMLDAGMTIEGYEGEGQLGNVSVSGCSMQSITYVNISPDKVYNVKFIPGAKDNLSPFKLKLKLNWTKSSETLFQAGFALAGGDENFQLQRYIEILKARGAAPDYGNSKSNKA